jgi:hypothetical protein
MEVQLYVVDGENILTINGISSSEYSLAELQDIRDCIENGIVYSEECESLEVALELINESILNKKKDILNSKKHLESYDYVNFMVNLKNKIFHNESILGKIL